jgi:hypothetical protein
MTIRYSDDAELRHILRKFTKREIKGIHPQLSKPAKYQSNTGHFRRDVYIT